MGGTFEVEVPADIKAGEEKEVPMTFKASGINSKVRFKFKATGPGDVTFKMTDSLGAPFEFVNEGYWGSAEGFDIPEGYEATTPVTLNFSAAGEYTIVYQLVKAETDEEISKSESTVTVNA